MDKLLLFFLIILFSVSVGAAAIYGTGDGSETIESQTNQMNTNTIDILSDANDMMNGTATP